MNNITACPLDCYDACAIKYDGKKIHGVKSGFTQGFLCPHLNHYESYERVQEPRYNGQIITMQEALKQLVQILKQSKEILHYRGNGNFALMQEVSDHFFASYGVTLTDGTLCDGAAEAGIIAGRGHNTIMSPKEIEKSEVVVFWGRNPHTTSSHLVPLLKDKKIIVIDPVRTKMADAADLYIQIKPHGDLQLAMLLARFACIEGSIDEEFLQSYASAYEEFYELTQTVRIKAVLNQIDVGLGDIGRFLELVHGKKVAIICGVGIQKYRDGADVMRAIDAFGALLGLFGKEGSGVSYMGNSKQGISSPFLTCKTKKVSKVDTKFGNFDTVFVQGANPLNQMPNTLRVKEEMEKVKNLIYFGLYENQTSQEANLVIPAKTFLEKEDVRTSYGTNAILFMPQQKSSEIGISEYELTKYLCETFAIPIQSEQEYLAHFASYAQEDEDGLFEVKGRDEIAYSQGFSTDDEEFVFLDEIDIDSDESEGLFLLTCKSAKSLNSQFKTDDKVYLHPSLGFAQDEEIELSSAYGTFRLHVSHDERLREDCVLIYSGTDGVNRLTGSQRSYEGNSAVFQENRVHIKRVV